LVLRRCPVQEFARVSIADAILEAGCAAAGAMRARGIALLRAAPITELPN
jgi:hypothetical protein